MKLTVLNKINQTLMVKKMNLKPVSPFSLSTYLGTSLIWHNAYLGNTPQ